MKAFDIKSLIRTIPDFPKAGVMFRDITSLLKNGEGLRATVDQLSEHFKDYKANKVVAIESRGFIIGAAIAYQLNVGFVPIRKPGKLPGESFGFEYDLEYGSDRLEIHTDAIAKDEPVLLIDDLIATGGTAEAAVKLVRMTGGNVIGCGFVIDLPDLGGRRRLEALGCNVYALCIFSGY